MHTTTYTKTYVHTHTCTSNMRANTQHTHTDSYKHTETYQTYALIHTPNMHTNTCMHIHTSTSNTHTHSSRGGNFPTSIRNSVKEQFFHEMRSLGRWWVVGWGRCLSCKPNKSSTLRDNTRVSFSNFPATNDNLKKVEVRPTLSARRQDGSMMNKCVSN